MWHLFLIDPQNRQTERRNHRQENIFISFPFYECNQNLNWNTKDMKSKINNSREFRNPGEFEADAPINSHPW